MCVASIDAAHFFILVINKKRNKIEYIFMRTAIHRKQKKAYSPFILMH